MATTQTGATAPAQFVRYAPELDVLSPHFEEDLETVVAGVEQYVVNSVAGEGGGARSTVRPCERVWACESRGGNS